MDYVIFWSWQSDLPPRETRSLIQDALKGATKDLTTDDAVKVKPRVDHDTKGIAGSPDIAAAIFDKIDKSDIFVCDVSLRKDANRKFAPNPNVLVELGYAIKALGQNRIIMVMNTAYGAPDKLPFDLHGKRTLTYQWKEGAMPSQEKGRLRAQLRDAIRTVIERHGHRHGNVSGAILQLSLRGYENWLHGVGGHRSLQYRFVLGLRNVGALEATLPFVRISNPIGLDAPYAFGHGGRTIWGLPLIHEYYDSSNPSWAFKGDLEHVVYPGDTLQVCEFRTGIFSSKVEAKGRVGFKYAVACAGYNFSSEVSYDLASVKDASELVL